MKKTPERIERLAAAYVLGSLAGRARQRFERWMMESVEVRREVWYWERRLAPMAASVTPETPPADLLERIEQRLWGDDQIRTPRSGAGWFWRGWSALATAAVVVMAVIMFQSPEPDQAALSGAVVQEGVKDPLWLVAEGQRGDRLRLRPVAATPPEPEKDYELWVVPKDGQPYSLGVIPSGDNRFEITLSEEARALLEASRTLAISLEPKGGSPKEVPTGPILHVTRLHTL
ncbi:hypothetical protein CF392_12580 [Tamilnaduibacter salinus]|uniref:Anti-sigma K factor RskA C-terminal domain-containing protein n=1 Tax=Tamilnaduibacter salinus TaxID=1484056 RepID=A0A2A2I1F0_9GAMM|nr:anti-sigma factor [Tamilnaduibacter salinus]PAV25126.1 hypothetical protein CF392_12580 [Tamilnaduibacter salinus]